MSDRDDRVRNPLPYLQADGGPRDAERTDILTRRDVVRGLAVVGATGALSRPDLGATVREETAVPAAVDTNPSPGAGSPTPGLTFDALFHREPDPERYPFLGVQSFLGGGPGCSGAYGVWVESEEEFARAVVGYHIEAADWAYEIDRELVQILGDYYLRQMAEDGFCETHWWLDRFAEMLRAASEHCGPFEYEVHAVQEMLESPRWAHERSDFRSTTDFPEDGDWDSPAEEDEAQAYLEYIYQAYRYE